MLPDTQDGLEQVMADMGRERYWAKVTSSRTRGRRTETPAGRLLLREAVGAVEGAVKAWLKRASMRAGQGHHTYKYVSLFAPGVVAMIAVRCVLDELGADNTLVRAAHGLGCALEEEARFNAVKDAESKVWRDLKRRLRRIRSKRSRAMILKDVSTKLALQFEPWPRKDKIRLGVVLIELIRQNTGLIEVVYKSATTPGKPLARAAMLVPTDSTLNWLEQSDEAHASLYPFYLPTLVEPRDWTDPWDGGYRTNLIVRRPMVKIHAARGLDAVASARMPAVYDAVNVLQRVSWRVNARVLETLSTLWEAGAPVADLPERVDEPPIPRPERFVDDAARREHRRACAVRRQRIVSSRSRRVLVAKIHFMAKMFAGKPFYYPYQADFRGRLYPTPFFLQPQGPSVARGLLEFARGAPIRDQEQALWFKIHGANCFGVDKVPFRKRVNWVQESHARIASVAADPVADRWWAGASKPWEFLAWCFEYAAWFKSPATFVSHLPVNMDGSNNGLQIFSLLMRDRVGGEATNCTPGDAPRDIYQDVADTVTARLLESTDADAAKWLEFCGGTIPRAATKRPVMTLPYGSTFHSCIHYTRDWYEAERKARGGATPFERGYDCSVYLARLIWSAIGDTVGSARSCMAWLRECASILAAHKKPVRWTSPSGFPVVQRYMKWSTSVIRTAVGDTVRDLKCRTDTEEIARRKQMNGVSPNYVHSLDAAAMVKAVSRARRAGVKSFMVVHDSYGVLAADAPLMARTLRGVYVDMFSRPLLEQLRDELQRDLPDGVVLPPVPEGGDLDVSDVRKSQYFFA